MNNEHKKKRKVTSDTSERVCQCVETRATMLTLSLCLFKPFYRALHHLFSWLVEFLSLDKQKKNKKQNHLSLSR